MAKPTTKKAVKSKSSSTKSTSKANLSIQGNLLGEIERQENELLPTEETKFEITVDPLYHTTSTQNNLEQENFELTGKSIIEHNSISTQPKWKLFYIQLNKGNILSIFSRAVILPSALITNRPFNDHQSKHPYQLLVSTGIIDDLTTDDALLQVFIKEEEFYYFDVNNGFGYIPALPVSRIHSIFVVDDDSKNKLIADAKVADAGVIPEYMIIPYFPENLKALNQEEIGIPPLSNNLSEKLTNFDSILGCLAYNRNSNLLYLNKSNSICYLNEHFWGALGALTSISQIEALAKPELTKYYKQLFEIDSTDLAPLNRWLFQRIKEKRNFLDNDTVSFEKIFKSQIKDKEQLNLSNSIFQKLQNSVERRKAYIDLYPAKSKDLSFLRLFYFLREYGNLNSEDRVTARKEIPQRADVHHALFIFALLGYFYGYTHLRTSDQKITALVVEFQQLLAQDEPITVKFNLQSSIDYLTIEAVFSYVFYGAILNSPPEYLETIRLNPKPKNFSGINYSKFKLENQKWLGTDIFDIETRNAEKDEREEVLQLLRSLPDVIPLASELGLFCFQNKIQLSFNLNILLPISGESIWDKVKGAIYFQRENIITALDVSNIEQTELKAKIQLSIENKSI